MITKTTYSPKMPRARHASLPAWSPCHIHHKPPSCPMVTKPWPPRGKRDTWENSDKRNQARTHHAHTPGLQADVVPTSQCVEIAFCKPATSHQQSSLCGRPLGSISTSNIPQPPPQQRPPPVPGMAFFSACASQLSTRATGASLHRALPTMQQVPVRLPLVEAKRCPASSGAYHAACVTLSPRHSLGMHSHQRAPHASPVYSDAALPTTCQHHDGTTFPTTCQPEFIISHWIHWLTICSRHS